MAYRPSVPVRTGAAAVLTAVLIAAPHWEAAAEEAADDEPALISSRPGAKGASEKQPRAASRSRKQAAAEARATEAARLEQRGRPAARTPAPAAGARPTRAPVAVDPNASIDDQLSAHLRGGGFAKQAVPTPRKTRRSRGGLGLVPPAGVDAPARKTARGRADRAGNKNDLDNLLLGALPADAGEGELSGLNKPRALRKEEFTEVMSGLSPKVNECGAALERPALAELKVEIDPAGTVSRVRVKGSLGGTITAGCIVQTVKQAAFPSSRGARFPYRYVVKPRERTDVLSTDGEAKPSRIERAEPEAAPPIKTRKRRKRGRDQLALPAKKAVEEDPLSGVRSGSIEGGHGKRKPRAKPRR